MYSLYLFALPDAFRERRSGRRRRALRAILAQTREENPQSIPDELKEAAARVEGASAARVFATVTLPLLMVATAPMLIGSFAYNFNNFTLIFLLTSGGPPVAAQS